MEKTTGFFVFVLTCERERETRLQDSSFLMSTYPFPNSLEYQFLLWYCLSVFCDPRTVGFLSQMLQPLTLYLRYPV